MKAIYGCVSIDRVFENGEHETCGRTNTDASLSNVPREMYSPLQHW